MQTLDFIYVCNKQNIWIAKLPEQELVSYLKEHKDSYLLYECLSCGNRVITDIISQKLIFMRSVGPSFCQQNWCVL